MNGIQDMPNGKSGSRVLITGITGFVGSHMADLLVDECELYGTLRWHHSSMQNIEHIEKKIKWYECDLTDPVGTNKLIAGVRPDVVYHFAAESFVSPSWQHPTLYMRTNYEATVNLLQAIREYAPEARILIPGSGEEFGLVYESELPITSKSELRPVNPYAVSKIAQDLIGYVYYVSYGLNIVRTRAFNHEGPRRDKVFGIPWYAYQVAMIEKGRQEPLIRVGHVDDIRNLTHVSDMVRAYQLAVAVCSFGEMNLIGTQDVHTFREALEGLIKRSTYSGKILYQQVAEFTRPTQVPRLIADTKPFAVLTGWKPDKTFEDILNDTLAYWRGKAKKE